MAALTRRTFTTHTKGAWDPSLHPRGAGGRFVETRTPHRVVYVHAPPPKPKASFRRKAIRAGLFAVDVLPAVPPAVRAVKLVAAVPRVWIQ